MNVVKGSQCAFVQYTQRSAAETAAEKTYNKLVVKGRRLNIKWGKSQGQQTGPKKPENPAEPLNPVPGLPQGTVKPLPKVNLSF